MSVTAVEHYFVSHLETLELNKAPYSRCELFSLEGFFFKPTITQAAQTLLLFVLV